MPNQCLNRTSLQKPLTNPAVSSQLVEELVLELQLTWVQIVHLGQDVKKGRNGLELICDSKCGPVCPGTALPDILRK